MLPRDLAAVVRAVLVVVVAAAVTRAAGAVLPSQPALVLAVATTLVLPGWALACAVGLSRRLDTVGMLGAAPVAGMAAWTPALALGFAVGLSFDMVLAIVALQTMVLLAVGDPRPQGIRAPDRLVLAIAVPVAALLSVQWQESLAGDAVFHLARVRKILAVPHLSLDSVSELANGKPHAGYVFPLLHAVEAAALRVAGIDPTTGFPDVVPAAVILMVFTTFAAGRAVGGTAVGTSALALVLWTWMVSSHPNLGMASWPGPFTFLVLLPVGVLAITELLRTPGDRRLTALLAATALSVSLVHVSYAVPLLALLVGVVAYTRRCLLPVVLVGAVTTAVFGFVWLVALHGYPKPVIRAGPYQHATSDVFVLVHGHALALNAENILAHEPGFLIALLALVPLLIWRAPSLAYPSAVMSGVLVLVAAPGPVLLLNATVGIGQTHRFGTAVPWELVTAVVAALVVMYADRRWILPALVLLGAAAAIGPKRVQSLWNFAPSFPTTPIAIAAVVGAAWYAVRRLRALPAPPMQAAVLPTLVVALAAVMLSDPSSLRTVASNVVHGHPRVQRTTLPAAIVNWVNHHGGSMPVVLSDQLRSYRLGAYTNAYVVAVPEVRTRAEPASLPEQRRQDVITFLKPSSSEAEREAIIRKYGVTVLVIPADHPGLITQLDHDPLLEQRLHVPGAGHGWEIYSVRPSS